MKVGWHKKQLAAVTKKITDGSHNPPKGVADSEYLMLSSKNVFDDDFHYEDPRYLSQEQFLQEDKRTGIEPGDVLLTIVGTIGRCAVVPIDAPKITLQRSVAVIRPDRAIVEPRFMMYSFIERNEELNEQARGVAQKGIYLEALRDLEIVLPPLSEQQRIVGILDEAFDGIATAKANAEQNLQNARALFESHLQSVFSQRGEGWETKELGDMCEVKDGTHDSPKYVQEGIPFVTQKNVREEGLSFSNTKFISDEDHAKFYKRSNVARGDILISMIGANRGMACLVDDERVFSIKNVGLVKENSSVNQRLLLYFLKSSQAAEYVSSKSKGGAQEFIGLTELRKFPVAIPELSEQGALVAKLDALSEETQRLESLYQRKLAALNELKKSLLHQAFSGAL